MHLLNNSNLLIENAIKLDSNIYEMNLKMMELCNKCGMHHTPTLIFCSSRAKPKCKHNERISYQSSYVNESGFKESISIKMHTRAQTVMLSSVSSYHAQLRLLA